MTHAPGYSFGGWPDDTADREFALQEPDIMADVTTPTAAHRRPAGGCVRPGSGPHAVPATGPAEYRIAA